MSGALASYPACPPFPAFTNFEAKALDFIAAEFDCGADTFRQQMASAKVTDRINTIHGFYTRIAADRESAPPIATDRLGGQFEVESIELGLGIIVWFEDGYVDYIEGFGYGTDVLAGIDLAELKFVSGQTI